ncbi:MAG: DUF3160 domain-containing protein [bacterium]|nr:DUF3160 domain-containing protein [bacterium]
MAVALRRLSPRIQTQATGLSNGIQFRFTSQRYMPDTYVLQRLSEYGIRTWPKGLDVMAALGSPRADEILTSVYHERETWDEYSPRLDSLKAEFSGYDTEWTRT